MEERMGLTREGAGELLVREVTEAVEVLENKEECREVVEKNFAKSGY